MEMQGKKDFQDYAQSVKVLGQTFCVIRPVANG